MTSAILILKNMNTVWVLFQSLPLRFDDLKYQFNVDPAFLNQLALSSYGSAAYSWLVSLDTASIAVI